MKDADRPIIAKLKEAGRILNVAVEHHSYPFCWRSDTPLIYRVRYPQLNMKAETLKRDTYHAPASLGAMRLSASRSRLKLP